MSYVIFVLSVLLIFLARNKPMAEKFFFGKAEITAKQKEMLDMGLNISAGLILIVCFVAQPVSSVGFLLGLGVLGDDNPLKKL